MKHLFATLFAFLLLFPAGCGQNSSGVIEDDFTQKFTVKDAVHGDQEIPYRPSPRRIVSFDYGVLDTIDALGATDSVVGLPKSNLPKLLERYRDDKFADVGNLFEPNYELLYTLKPDLIIVSGRAAAKIEDLRKIAPTIFLEPKNDDYYNTFTANVKLIGQILNLEEAASSKLAELDKKVASVKTANEASGKNALISLYTGGKISVYGPQSRFGVLHQAFGLKPADTNIKEAAQHGQVVNFEYIKQVDPDYLFVIDRAQILGEETVARSFLDNDVLRSTKAFKNNGVIYLDTENWYTVSGGLQSMSKMVDEIASLSK